MRISVIIPCVDEEVALAHCLDRLQDLGVADEAEFIVVDGGSADRTRDVAAERMARLVETPRGRARQMNEGAGVASGEWLLFLHADTMLTLDAWRSWQAALAPDLVGGAFARRFVPAGLVLAITARLADLRGRFFGIFLGDQALFVRKHVFHDLGGFNETVPYGEDLLFSLRLRQAGRTCLVRSPIQSSARRFRKKGALRQTILDFIACWRLVRENSPKSSEKGE